MISRHPLREGLTAGALGASSIAVWSFLVDAITDRAGVTAALLGAWIYDALAGSFGGRGFGVHVLTWVVALFVIVIAISVVTSYLYNAAEVKPSFFAGLIGVVAVLEVILVGLTVRASQTPIFGSWAWLHGLLGNVIGAFVIGRYLWRRHHPEAVWDWEHENDVRFHHTGEPGNRTHGA